MKHYVLMCSHRCSGAVMKSLSYHGIDYYCPMLKQQKRRRDASGYHRENLTPLFPGYMFVSMDFTTQHPSCFAAMSNIIGLVNFGGQPAEVSDEVLLAIKAQENTFAHQMRGIKSINSELAAILAMPNPDYRAKAFIHYICQQQKTSFIQRRKNECSKSKYARQT